MCDCENVPKHVKWRNCNEVHSNGDAVVESLHLSHWPPLCLRQVKCNIESNSIYIIIDVQNIALDSRSRPTQIKTVAAPSPDIPMYAYAYVWLVEFLVQSYFECLKNAFTIYTLRLCVCKTLPSAIHINGMWKAILMQVSQTYTPIRMNINL